MTRKIGPGKVPSTIHRCSTQAEAIRKAADQYHRTRLTPKMKAIMTRLLAWRRG